VKEIRNVEQQGVVAKEHVPNMWQREGHHITQALNDFRKFMLRGNVIDLAVGIVIGTAFASLVSSFVKDFITPLIGLIGVPHLDSYTFTLGSAANSFRIGDFLNGVISFVIMAAVVFFLVVRPVATLQNRLIAQKKSAPTTYNCPFCLSAIPLKATRCAHCTSQLPSKEAQA
jgi:large conductance mechanosensitive channel